MRCVLASCCGFEPFPAGGHHGDSPRIAPGVLDSARGRAYVYTRSALWSLDLSAGTWSTLPLANHPRIQGVALNWATERMVLDPVTDRLLLMWGPEEWNGLVRGETWALDLAAPAAWTRLALDGPWTRTPVVIDVAQRRLVSFSGH